MPVVPRILLDHVRKNPPQRVRGPVPPMHPGDVQRFSRSHDLPRPRTCLAPQPKRLVGISIVDREVNVLPTIVSPIERPNVLAAHDAQKPTPLDVGHMPNEPEQRQLRRRHSPHPKLRRAQPRALPSQRLPLILQEPAQDRPLIPLMRRINPQVLTHAPIIPAHTRPSDRSKTQPATAHPPTHPAPGTNTAIRQLRCPPIRCKYSLITRMSLAEVAGPRSTQLVTQCVVFGREGFAAGLPPYGQLC